MNYLPRLPLGNPARSANNPPHNMRQASIDGLTTASRSVVTGPIHLPTVGLNTQLKCLELPGTSAVQQRDIQAFLDRGAPGYNALNLSMASQSTRETFVSLDFSKCPQLNMIALPRTATLRRLTGLETCHQLKEFRAGGGETECQSFDNDTRAALQQLSSLLLLSLENNDVTAAEIVAIIQHNPNLHQIVLGDRAKVHAVLHRLKGLDLGGREYGAMYRDAGLCDIRLIIRPSEADNQTAYLSEDAWQLIQHLPNALTAPALNGLERRDDDVSTLMFNYGDLFSLLDFHDCTYRHMFTWFDASHLVNIEVLNLSGMENLVDLTGLGACNRLQFLWLSNCKSLSANSRDAVTETKQLQEIYLNGTCFDSHEILQIVRHNHSLVSVIIDRNSAWKEIQDTLNGYQRQDSADPEPQDGIGLWETVEVSEMGEALALHRCQ